MSQPGALCGPEVLQGKQSGHRRENQSFEVLSLTEIQQRIDSFLTALFQYWLKKKGGNYLRISKFY